MGKVFPLPVHVGRRLWLCLTSVDVKVQRIVPLFGRDLPPKTQGAGAKNGGLNGGLLAVADRGRFGAALIGHPVQCWFG